MEGQQRSDERFLDAGCVDHAWKFPSMAAERSAQSAETIAITKGGTPEVDSLAVPTTAAELAQNKRKSLRHRLDTRVDSG